MVKLSKSAKREEIKEMCVTAKMRLSNLHMSLKLGALTLEEARRTATEINQIHAEIEKAILKATNRDAKKLYPHMPSSCPENMKRVEEIKEMVEKLQAERDAQALAEQQENDRTSSRTSISVYSSASTRGEFNVLTSDRQSTATSDYAPGPSNDRVRATATNQQQQSASDNFLSLTNDQQRASTSDHLLANTIDQQRQSISDYLPASNINQDRVQTNNDFRGLIGEYNTEQRAPNASQTQSSSQSGIAKRIAREFDFQRYDRLRSFSGKCTEFPQFWECFLAFVDSADMPDTDKLNLLLEKLEPKVAQIIRLYQGREYNQAKEFLVKQYMNKHAAQAEVMQTLNQLGNRINISDASALNDLAEKLAYANIIANQMPDANEFKSSIGRWRKRGLRICHRRNQTTTQPPHDVPAKWQANRAKQSSAPKTDSLDNRML
ncbi:hypothetical protein QR98_0014150 [Sarcoptes scabiei]|uniref:Uncharacterized protein n=1 Tax=Sarcoptes scabiei TaxID=52283 RepID=A0A131ZVU9_SARSC|nr:hypothetical protein QR98_0014150 [Sarcoptes scabiei]